MSSEKIYSKLILKRGSEEQKKPKKIIPTQAKSGIREIFKKTFLPLLIDVFELRQMISAHKARKKAPDLPVFGKTTKTPLEILEQLESVKGDVEETLRWCSGVITQIGKAIDEAKEALDDNPDV